MVIFCSGDTSNIEEVIKNSLVVFRHILDNGLHKDMTTPIFNFKKT